MENPDTRVTYFRTSLDPFDFQRLDDIINRGGSDTTTPAAALATHLRRLNPLLRWNTPNLVDAMTQEFSLTGEGGVDACDIVILDAASFETDGSSNCFLTLHYASGFRSISRGLWIPTVNTVAFVNLPRATSTGIVERTDPRAVPVTRYDTTAAIVRLKGPIAVGTLMMFSPDSFTCTPPLTDVDPDVPAGFVPVGWSDMCWKKRRLHAPGRDFFADVTRSVPSSFVSAVAQGATDASVVKVDLIH